jgi:hypothetical protein
VPSWPPYRPGVPGLFGPNRSFIKGLCAGSGRGSPLGLLGFGGGGVGLGGGVLNLSPLRDMVVAICSLYVRPHI